jgi:hypothetical protein
MKGYLVALSFVGVALPAAALAQNALNASTSSAQSPVTINTCEPILYSPGPSPSPNPIAALLQPQTSSGMHIQFTNESGKVADLVNFEVTANGTQFVIRDVGTFSPAITIDHRYRNGSGQPFILPAFIPPNVKCRVLSVRFNDRTVWPPSRAEGIAAAPESSTTSLSANPSSLVVPRDAESALVMISSSARVAGFNESDTCQGIANVFVSTTAQTSAVYSIKPVGPGDCAIRIVDEAGRTINVPVTVK